MSWIHFVLVMCIYAQFTNQAKLGLSTEELSKCFPFNKLSPSMTKTIPAEYIQSRFYFSVDLMKEVIKHSKPDSNVFFSPHSIYQALLLTLFISSGYTESNVKTALRVPDNLVNTYKFFSRCDLIILYESYKEESGGV